MTAALLGLGVGLPSYSVDREESVAYGRMISCATDEQHRLLPALYRMVGVRRRYSVILDAPSGSATERQSFYPPPNGPGDKGPTVGKRMQRYATEAGPLAETASRAALTDARCAAESITHLVTVSCSGFAAPGIDHTLIERLGLPPTVERVNVGFMGCHGALNGLRVAKGLAAGDGSGARVLLCAVELCSLHYHYGWDPEQVVANALFADGAAAAVVGAGDQPACEPAWRVHATGSCLIPNSEDAMTWRIGDYGFEMTLSARVPELIADNLPGWIASWLDGHGLAPTDIASWAVHPGGPRILNAVDKCLGLGDGALDVSRSVLRDYGNMSSPTILFILKQLRDAAAETPCVALGFGPGLTAEAVLFA
ncbi:MAG: type III polyketide synthase [Candidatus Hydrogenedentota bacterium]